MLRNRIRVVVVAVAAVIMSSLLPSRAYAEVKIAVVDLQQALEKSQAGAKAEKEYKAQVDSAQKKLDKQKEDFEKSKGDYDKQADSLSAEAKASKQEKLVQMEKDLKRVFHDSQESLQRTNAKLVSQLVKEIREVVKQIGQDGGYNLVLEKGNPALLYADSTIDITERVVTAFDKSTAK